MRCHTRYLRLAVLIGLLGSCTFSYLSVASAQTSSIVLAVNSQGNYVYMNTGDSDSDHAASKVSSSAASSVPTAAWGKTGPTIAAPPMIRNLVEKTASRFQVDPKLVDAMIRVESAYNSRAVSPKGAMGLMQLIPATAHRFGVENPFDPRQNIRGGVTFLRYLLDRFDGSIPLSLAAYNAGEHRLGRDGGIPSIPETVTYVRRVTSLYRASHTAHAGLAPAAAQQPADPVYHYVDAYGVVHFSND